MANGLAVGPRGWVALRAMSRHPPPQLHTAPSRWGLPCWTAKGEVEVDSVEVEEGFEVEIARGHGAPRGVAARGDIRISDDEGHRLAFCKACNAERP